MRVIVCGGRKFADYMRMCEVLDALHHKHPEVTIIQGGASGADEMARDWCKSRKVACETFPADWPTHGRAAGPIRNQEMLDSGVHGVVVFPGGRGTADMHRRAKDAGKPVWVVDGCNY